jgi:GMP synthase (glutamine-hydrolysing)
MTTNLSGNLSNGVLIIDFGSQYTQLIARRIREMKVYSEIYPYNISINKIKSLSPAAIILSGGPSSLYEMNAPKVDKSIFSIGIPILGICYGLYIIIDAFNGKIEKAASREYGRTLIRTQNNSHLFKKLSNSEQVWMSHGDKVVKIPNGFTITGSSKNAKVAAIENQKLSIYGLQFHPEVYHTTNGKTILENFVYKISKLKPLWTMDSFIETSIKSIREQVGDGNVLLGLSGGVDSSVTAALLQKAVGDKLVCIFVNNGLLRKSEAVQVIERFKRNMNLNLRYVDASNYFIKKLKRVTNPEKKRKIIGREFINVFMKEAKKIGKFDFLAQGTLYPDVIESVSTKGPSDTIKSHHNRVPEVLRLISMGKVIEPLKELFKDEVRVLGKHMNMSHELLNRHPFPGPGLAIRIIGEVTHEHIKILQDADDIIITEIKNAGLYNELWQIFGVFLPVKSVGVMGDNRTYDNVIAIRAVTSVDAMTADWAYLPEEVMRLISNRIINEVHGINRVVYDISSKPPSTIEWE